ncbi:peptide chain release factor N(5)-glutamine methyltransferase [uncultured Hyphomonas sp.]|uniref:peptide chain release factor N(5)-glutamine methyltransferase n=1 Tax=uncultured Hyphomonas sp. TaxID=225298 RepID=UPI002AABEA7D|nr:peptide chain release factor N(5)-glutamine methyltransferase [uncultured Hyphomonas sp.]
MRTYQALLRTGTQGLREAGIEEPAHEVRLMMMAASGLSRTALISAETDDVPGDVADRFTDMLRKRQARQPLQHILGTIEFYGLEFVCDERALIPRPDSEVVAEAALRLIPEGEAMTIADLGTGTGCLLAALLANRPNVRGAGIEASPQAASLARENLSRLGLEGRASVFEGSWADWPDWQAADLIISNPPYIASGKIAGLAPEVRTYDPMAALDGGEDGLEAYREIIALARQNMKPGTWLVFEIGYDQKETVSGLLGAAEFTAIGAAKDLGGNDRAVWGRKPEK